ncbi:TPA: protein phosphatase 2C domain-containing protein [Burkholderia cepacia ATCC 25416]|uniref:PP2C family serine/threonine-protein phosphatase n=1 Tax=Burkholderia cepacia complex TaxID=87882 RepID=UPI00064AF0A5|nr:MULTISPECIES: PP2C family serine/threonine-protein phosphatase [Burkholderia cepacia complex]HDR9767554.1 protein phosphatase 2C domain-containing protein [Burkholderia cepacia ATCC 25416]AKM42835.1 serine/threonine protein phosphatase [Burkholderia contaminans]MCA8074170.1 protein phosphatase 2C domain-containing protein [Burkholderia cepacia]HDR9774756.1 protein phosphatase 2C domain-containing protein [Burkholderia cepacia ATCC 25416]HDR9783714.1 protein phosphatase 2C domain-containing 
MSWKVIGASVVGSSHVHNSAPCQDSCFYHVAFDAAGTEVLVALVSDGAGSAQFGEVGSEIACEAGGKRLLEIVETCGEAGLESSVAIEVLDVVRTRIDEAAQARGVTPRALACTLLGAVVGTTRAFYFQVGDGAIVSRESGALTPVFWPESGEYANMTYFVTDANASEHLRSDLRNAPDELSLFSDGIQRLALVFATETAHEPFFEPMFKALRASSDEQTDSLCAALERFLSSDAINERTDDDKTLILATRPLGAGSVSSI